MQVLLVRHAIAEPRSSAVEESERALTPAGRERFERCVTGLLALGLRVDHVLTSPWRRARETAEMLRPLHDAPGRVDLSELLADGPSPALLEALVALEDAGVGTVALVGHEPWLSELLSWLVAGDVDAARVEMKKGAVARLEGRPTPGGMLLRALLPPKVLRALP